MQDLRIHRTEIHSKLVAIMRERLMANLKQLPSIAASWGQGAPGPKQPSQFAQTNAKQLRILSQVCIEPLALVLSSCLTALHSVSSHMWGKRKWSFGELARW